MVRSGGEVRNRPTAGRWSDLYLLDREQTAELLRGIRNHFYVYVLCKKGGTPFYVGKGFGRRIFQHEAEAWNTTVVSHKLNVIRKIAREGGSIRYAIAAHFEREEDAHDRERALIAQYGRHDLGRGPLTNQIDGGEGASNPSEEARARHAASLGGDAADPSRRVANRFLASIAGGQDSVPIKPWAIARTRAHLLRPSPNKPTPKVTPRMCKAVAASAVANSIVLAPYVAVPRRLVIDGVECIIENGCGGDMIAAGLVESIEGQKTPLDQQLRLTSRGYDRLIECLGRERLVDLGILSP